MYSIIKLRYVSTTMRERQHCPNRQTHIPEGEYAEICSKTWAFTGHGPTG
jgi:hypothetical protein